MEKYLFSVLKFLRIKTIEQQSQEQIEHHKVAHH